MRRFAGYLAGMVMGLMLWSDGRALLDGVPLRRYTFREDYCFFVGDNCPNSRDSRYFGFVPEKFVIGIFKVPPQLRTLLPQWRTVPIATSGMDAKHIKAVFYSTVQRLEARQYIGESTLNCSLNPHLIDPFIFFFHQNL